MDMDIISYSIMLSIIVGLVLTVLVLSARADEFQDIAEVNYLALEKVALEHVKLQRKYSILEAVAAAKLNEWITVEGVGNNDHRVVVIEPVDVDAPVPYLVPDIEHYN